MDSLTILGGFTFIMAPLSIFSFLVAFFIWRSNNKKDCVEKAVMTLIKGEAEKNYSLPKDLRIWNWGAFALSWIWGIGNGVYFSFFIFIPIVLFVFSIIVSPYTFPNIFVSAIGLFMIFAFFGFSFYLGANGNELAWRKTNRDSIIDFLHSQRIWAVWGIIIYIILMLVLSYFFLFF